MNIHSNIELFTFLNFRLNDQYGLNDKTSRQNKNIYWNVSTIGLLQQKRNLSFPISSKLIN